MFDVLLPAETVVCFHFLPGVIGTVNRAGFMFQIYTNNYINATTSVNQRRRRSGVAQVRMDSYVQYRSQRSPVSNKTKSNRPRGDGEAGQDLEMSCGVVLKMEGLVVATAAASQMPRPPPPTPTPTDHSALQSKNLQGRWGTRIAIKVAFTAGESVSSFIFTAERLFLGPVHKSRANLHLSAIIRGFGLGGEAGRARRRDGESSNEIEGHRLQGLTCAIRSKKRERWTDRNYLKKCRESERRTREDG